jgi:DNA-binding IclR family transcriptional regulator
MLLDQDIAKSKEVMSRIEESLGFTIGLGVLQADQGNGVVVAAVDGKAGFSFHLEVDFEFPLHTSAPGKAFLAYMPAKERGAAYARMDFRQYTPSTIIRPEDMDPELESVIEKGYATDVSEQLEGCHCIGVPVFDAKHRVVAALWTTAPSSQLPVRCFDAIAQTLKKGALEISQRLSSSSRSPNRDYINNVVGQARKIMEGNLGQPLDVQQLAKNLYVGYSWFRKVFKEQTGEAPWEYHLSRRIEKACELLHDNTLSVRQVSEELGFKTQNHFSALFKRRTGVSPTAWRMDSGR